MQVRFTAWHAYPLFDAGDPSCVGGAETRAWLLATGLARRSGFEVQFVVRTPRRFQEQRFDDFTVLNMGNPLDGWRNNVARSLTVGPGLFHVKLFRWDPRLLWQAPVLAVSRLVNGPRPAPEIPAPIYAERPVDVECCFGVSAQSAAVVTAARNAQIPSVLFLASNNDLDERFTPDSTHVTVHGERGDICRRAIDGATRIVAQHAEQQRLLKERFGRDSVVLPNPIDLAAWDRALAQPGELARSLQGKRFALWVGRADDFHKRPQLCIDLARRLPGVRFVMILNPWNDEVERAVRSSRPDNVTIVPSVPFAEMPQLLSAAAAYVSTGSPTYEGSPNLFLQAAASRIPIASLDVSTPLLTEASAGFAANGDLDRLADYVSRMVNDPVAARAAGDAGRQYVEEHHSSERVVDHLAGILHELGSA